MKTARYVAQAGVVAAVYGGLTLLAVQLPGQLGWGLIQFRLSEALTVVACFTPAAVPGLWLGSVAANSTLIAQLGPIALWDVTLGSLGSLLGAAWTWRLRSRPLLALVGPVVTNALIVPAYLPLLLKGLGLFRLPLIGLDLEGAWLPMYLFGVVSVAVGQAVVVYGLGWPLYSAMRRLGADALLGEKPRELVARER